MRSAIGSMVVPVQVSKLADHSPFFRFSQSRMCEVRIPQVQSVLSRAAHTHALVGALTFTIHDSVRIYLTVPARTTPTDDVTSSDEVAILVCSGTATVPVSAGGGSRAS